MRKNLTGQKAIFFAFNSTTNLPVTGDAANITAYVSIDYGTVTILGDTSATEASSTLAKGYYLFDLTQAETNGDTLLFSANSVTANVVVVGVPATVFTLPTTGILAPTTAGRTLTVAATSGGVTLADGVAHGGTPGSSTATLALDHIVVQSQFDDVLVLRAGSGSGGNCITLQADGGGSCLLGAAGDSGDAFVLQASGGKALVLTALNEAISVSSDSSYGLSISAGDHAVLLGGDGMIWDDNAGQPVFVTLADDVEHGGSPGSSTATMALQKVVVVAADSDPAVQLGDGSSGAEGLKVLAGPSSPAVSITSADSNGIQISAALTGLVIDADAGVRVTALNSIGLEVTSVAGQAVSISGGSSGISVTATDSYAVQLQTLTSGPALNLLGAGAGISISAGGLGIDIAGSTGGINVATSAGPGIASAGSAGSYGLDATLSPATLASYFLTDSGTTYASAVAGSVVKEIASNAGGSTPPTAVQIRQEMDSNSTKLASIDAKTTNLPSDPADASDIASSFSTVNASLALIAGYIDTEIGNIQSRLPAALVGGKMDSTATVTGVVTIDTAQAIASSQVDGTVGAVLLGLEAQSVGKWVIVGTTLNLYRRDGVTLVRSFTLAPNATNPISRT